MLRGLGIRGGGLRGSDFGGATESWIYGLGS